MNIPIELKSRAREALALRSGADPDFIVRIGAG